MESFRRRCASVRGFWKFDPNKSFLRLPYLMMTFGAVHLDSTHSRWMRWMMVFNRSLATYQYCISLVAVWLVLWNGKDAFALIWSVAVVISFTVCNVKARLLTHYLGLIRDIGHFIDGKPGNSGDAEFDLATRHDVFRKMRSMSAVVYVYCVCVQIIMLIPIEQIQRLFGAPKEFDEFGLVVAQTARNAALFWKPIIWMSRLFCGTLTFTGLLVALIAELKIVEYGLACIMDRVRAAVDENWDQMDSDKDALFWKYLNLDIKHLTDQHAEILRNVNLLKSAAGFFYFIIHYYSLACVSAIIAVSLFEGFSFGSVAIAGTACGYFAQCYWWCYVIDSFEDTVGSMRELIGSGTTWAWLLFWALFRYNSGKYEYFYILCMNMDIADQVYYLSMEIRFSEKFRHEYKAMMKSLMLVHANAARSNLFTCGGVFPISIAAFGDLCNLTYNAIMFVLNAS